MLLKLMALLLWNLIDFKIDFMLEKFINWLFGCPIRNEKWCCCRLLKDRADILQQQQAWLLEQASILF